MRRSAAGAVGAADRARSGAERRDRTTAVNNKGPAHIGTSGEIAGGKRAQCPAARPTPRPAVRGGGRRRKRGRCGTPLQDVDCTTGGFGERTAWSGARCWMAS